MQFKRILIILLILGMMPLLAACSRTELARSGNPDPAETLPAARPSPTPVTGPSQPEPDGGSRLPAVAPGEASSVLAGETSAQPSLTPTLAPTPVPWDGYPAPNATPLSTAVPPPAPKVSLPDGVQVLALLGTDSEAPYLGRTDTILLVFYNVHNGKASLLSVPRDLYVYIPGYTMDRINTAYVSGGIDLLFLTLEYNLGVRPNHWALAHLNDFSQFVDDLGGVTVQVPAPVVDPWCSVPAGKVHLSGYSALCYVRSRMGSSDFDRSRR
ncbi:MAG TPA: LCP family protein, partial [Anaerolineales bacterium]